jgi:hypothetical protein
VTAGTSRAPTIYAALALIAAIVIGSAVGYALGRRSLMKRAAPGGRSVPEMTLLGVSRSALADSLGLSPAQRATVDSLLEQARRTADSMVGRMITDVRAATGQVRRQVRAVLNDGQRLRFDSLLNSATPLLPRTPVPTSRP